MFSCTKTQQHFETKEGGKTARQTGPTSAAAATKSYFGFFGVASSTPTQITTFHWSM